VKFCAASGCPKVKAKANPAILAFIRLNVFINSNDSDDHGSRALRPRLRHAGAKESIPIERCPHGLLKRESSKSNPWMSKQ
jgi:hypothetical protein